MAETPRFPTFNKLFALGQTDSKININVLIDEQLN